MRAERLVRAAVTAFCSLTRPSRSEIAQLDDLAMPLYDQLSPETRRYMAAALSECEYAPALLVRRLCDDTIEIAAPLLVRSPLLREIDLVALIGRHGLPHARVIARRPDLDSTIAALVRALEIPSMKIAAEEPLPQITEPAPAPEQHAGSGQAAKETRDRLRMMMRPAGTERKTPGESETVAIHWPSHPGLFDKLRSTALTGVAGLFQTALADALGIGFHQARSITETQTDKHLILALRALDLAPSDAFLLAAATFPTRYPRPEAIRRFLEEFELVHRDKARDAVRSWKAETIAQTAVAAKPAPAPAQADASPVHDRPANAGGERMLRAS